MTDRKLTDGGMHVFTALTNSALLYVVDLVTGNMTSGSIVWTAFKTLLDALYMALVAPGTAGNILTSNGATWISSTPAASGFPTGFIFGLTLSNGTDATNDIDIAAGKCRGVADDNDMVLASALVGKQLDAVWAVGANAGMRASGAAIANTTYHIFLIKRTDTGVVDVAADTSPTGANIAANTNANYTIMRRIGSIVRISGSINPFFQTNDTFMWQTPVTDLSATNPGTAAVTRTLTLPVGIRVLALLSVEGEGISASSDNPKSIYISDLSLPDLAPAAPAPMSFFAYASVAIRIGGQVSCYTNTSAQVRSRIQVSTANTNLQIGTNGWIDDRGKSN